MTAQRQFTTLSKMYLSALVAPIVAGTPGEAPSGRTLPTSAQPAVPYGHGQSTASSSTTPLSANSLGFVKPVGAPGAGTALSFPATGMSTYPSVPPTFSPENSSSY